MHVERVLPFTMADFKTMREVFAYTSDFIRDFFAANLEPQLRIADQGCT
jgi:hypothetical protein